MQPFLIGCCALQILETVMFKYIDLCVELKKGRYAKDGLIHYRNVCQHVNVASLEEVIRYFMNAATKRAEDATASAEVFCTSLHQFHQSALERCPAWGNTLRAHKPSIRNTHRIWASYFAAATAFLICFHQLASPEHYSASGWRSTAGAQLLYSEYL